MKRFERSRLATGVLALALLVSTSLVAAVTDEEKVKKDDGAKAKTTAKAETTPKAKPKSGAPLCPAPAPESAAVNTLEDLFGDSGNAWLTQLEKSEDETQKTDEDAKKKTKKKLRSDKGKKPRR
ncbi:MAG: hypothetical protein OEV00_11990 [Acidobacteriota bacterium]|nr:hypothetical protein [Acidobacteriota bacterium]MDH3786033.1 hypothetical protein [Acidobacteriota bacterium]